MTYDEVLVQIVKDATVNQIDNRVYHLEVYQTNEKFNEYPCCLYSLRINRRNGGSEISGVSGYMVGEFDVTAVAKDSASLKAITDNLFDLAEEASNEDLYDVYSADGFDWIDVDLNQENIEYAIELEAKGYKTATVSVCLYHRELENNASN